MVKTYNIPPELIFNTDETALDGVSRMKKALEQSDGKRPLDTVPKKEEHDTFLFFVSAAGETLSPLIIFPLKTVPPLSDNVVGKCNMAGSNTGFITSEILRTALVLGFIPEVNEIRVKLGLPGQKALLIIDNHSSRKCITEESELFESNDILVLYIPPHSSHLIQPLDRGINLTFKCEYRKHYENTPGLDRKTLRNNNIQIALKCYEEATTRLKIEKAWKHAGMWPINRNRPLLHDAVKIELEEIPNALKRKVGEKFGKNGVTFKSRKVARYEPNDKENNNPNNNQNNT